MWMFESFPTKAKLLLDEVESYNLDDLQRETKNKG
jgi:hypothetical protein